MNTSKHSGMGAVLFENGTAFRVWAPNAQKVFVAGSFNNWSENSNPLQSEENGYWSADVKKAKAGNEYKFIIINNGKKLFKNDPYAKEISRENNSVIIGPKFDWEEDKFNMPSWNELIIYEMHIGTFNTENKKIGNFKSARKKFSYLKELGVNAIELMPIMEFPGESSWGYNLNYPFAVEKDYGGVKEFKTFIKEAHKNGLAVILDIVFNHFGPNEMDLWQFDGWSENGNGGIYFYNDDRGESPWGPRPDYGRPEVRQYLRDNALMWLDEFHIDGLRWDSITNIRNKQGLDSSPASDIAEGWSLMQWINNEINSRFPWKIKIAEDLKGNVYVTKSTEEDGAGFDAQWDYHFVHPVRKVIISNDDSFRDLNLLKEAITYKENDDAFRRIIYTESHDEVSNGKARIPEEIWPGNVSSWFSKKRSLIGSAITLTSPGIPMLFQGQELLEDRWFQDNDPIDWKRTEKFKGFLLMHKDILRLRRNLDGITKGLTGQFVNIFLQDDKNKIVVFHRWYNGGKRDSVIVVINLRNKIFENYNIGFPEKGLWKVRFNSDSKNYDKEFGNFFSPDTEAVDGEKNGMPFNGNVNIGAYTVLIFSQD